MSSQSLTVALSMQSREHAEGRGVSFSVGGEITSGGREERLKAPTKESSSASAHDVLLSDVSTFDTSLCVCYFTCCIFFQSLQ